MGLLKRLSYSFILDKESYSFANDKAIITILFFLVLSIIFALPDTINIMTQDVISYEDKTIIRNEFTNLGDDIPFTIQNGVLINKTNELQTISVNVQDAFHVIISNENKKSEIIDVKNSTYIVFNTDGVYLQKNVYKIRMFTYNDYESLEGLDFSLARVNDKGFWDSIFNVFDSLIDQYKTFIRVTYILVSFFSSALSICFWTAVIALFQKFSSGSLIKYKTLWKMAIYYATPYVICSVLSVLFGFGLLYYIGFILLFIYTSMFSKEMLKRGGNDEL